MQCWVYRSTRKDEMYVYLAREDDFDSIPEALRSRIGRLEKAMELELTPKRKLARADAIKVMQALRDQGFFLQMPPEPLRPDLYFGD
ncbi:MAG: YcgL domain-containing protein [Gammaproteobacteria bacterium]|nr:YcgL domain-containing protein [Gammaproteobacteria bacterium]MCP5137260.1 YcgL domain-containing protein [Gammaproteobacteria bacterium]